MKIPPIVAWDGEGEAVPDGQPQPYVLLMSSSGVKLWADSPGLHSRAVFKALTDEGAKHPKGTLHFIYGGSYDINQWLKDVPEYLLRRLWRSGKCEWESYFIEYRPRKMFRLVNRATNKRITIWDAYPWCQSSFVKALESYLGKDYPDLDFIKMMKDRRSSFSREERAEVERYTTLELKALVELCRALIERLYGAGIYVRRWDGPGAAAAALLRERGVKRYKAETPRDVRYAAAVAYSGGRIELLKYGNYERPVYHYDIRSAYPAAMCHLPILAGAKWAHYEQGERAPVKRWGLYRVRWSLNATADFYPFYPFCFRNDDGSIYYPPEGESWAWGPEVLAYQRHADKLPDLRVEILEAYVLEQWRQASPLDWVRELYELRRQWKAEGNAAEWALKLGINSLYGKLAQTVGWNANRKPPFYQLEWAGLITSYTRAYLFDMAMQNPHAIIMFATDGIYATEPLEMDVGDGLGQWEESIHAGITTVQAGVYFVTDDGENWRTWSRGYNPGELSRDAIIAGWNAGTESLGIPQSRFVTLGSALTGKSIAKDWRAWHTSERSLSLGATGKREELHAEKRKNPAKEFRITQAAFPFGNSSTGLSAPYNRSWKENETERVDGVPLVVYEAELAESAI